MGTLAQIVVDTNAPCLPARCIYLQCLKLSHDDMFIAVGLSGHGSRRTSLMGSNGGSHVTKTKVVSSVNSALKSEKQHNETKQNDVHVICVGNI